MACNTGRCALRRFEGHGSSNYRPTNPAAEREFKSNMERLMAERARQDVAYFPGAGASAESSVSASASADLQKRGTGAVPVPRPIPGAGLLRQLTPTFSPKRGTATADTEDSAEATAEAEEKPTGPFWSLSS
jgi:hypothetical protein